MTKKDTALKDAVYKFFTEDKKPNEVTDLYLKILEVNPYYVVVTDSNHSMIAQFDSKSLLDKESFNVADSPCLYVKKAELVLRPLSMDITSLRDIESTKSTLSGIEIVTEIKDSSPSSSPSPKAKEKEKFISRPPEDIEYSYCGIEAILKIMKFSVITEIKYKEEHGLLKDSAEAEKPHIKNLFEVDDIRTSILYYRFRSLVLGIKTCRKSKVDSFKAPSFSEVFKSSKSIVKPTINIAQTFCSNEDEEDGNYKALWFLDPLNDKGQSIDFKNSHKKEKESWISINDKLLKDKGDNKKSKELYFKRVEKYRQEVFKEKTLSEDKSNQMKFMKLPKSLRPKKDSKGKVEAKRNLFCGDKRQKDEEKRPKVDFNTNAPKNVENVLKGISKLTNNFFKLNLGKSKKDKKKKDDEEEMSEVKDINIGKFQSFILWLMKKQESQGLNNSAENDCKEENMGVIKTKLEDVNKFYPKDQDFTMKLKGKTFELLGVKYNIEFGETVESSKKLMML